MGSRVDESFDRDFGDITDIDEGDSTSSGRHEDAAIVDDVVSISITKVLSKEAWPEDGPAGGPTAKVLLDRVMGHEGIVPGPRDGDEDDVPHALLSRYVEKRVQGSAGV